VISREENFRTEEEEEKKAFKIHHFPEYKSQKTAKLATVSK
jgi:hypothetical protein